MKVEIKERQLTAGNRSLYLEYYETGFRKKENLHLYLIPDPCEEAQWGNLPQGAGDTCATHPESSDL